MSLFKELQTRNVFKVGIAYLVIGWVVVQIADTALPRDRPIRVRDLLHLVDAKKLG